MKLHTRTLLLIGICTALTGVALGLFVVGAQDKPATETVRRHNRMATCWNDAVASVARENPLWDELSESLHAEPPHRSVSARRLELYRLILAEREQQAQALKCLQAYEAKP